MVKTETYLDEKGTNTARSGPNEHPIPLLHLVALVYEPDSREGCGGKRNTVLCIHIFWQRGGLCYRSDHVLRKRVASRREDPLANFERFER